MLAMTGFASVRNVGEGQVARCMRGKRVGVRPDGIRRKVDQFRYRRCSDVEHSEVADRAVAQLPA